MVAYNFKAEFADSVATGDKCQTIRPDGKRRHARKGDAVQLYTGQRTADCRKLGDGVCTMSTYCAIREDTVTLGNHPSIPVDEFARADGFKDYEDMKAWFREMYGLPFIGRLVKWQLR
jgi:hypothetical protein